MSNSSRKLLTLLPHKFKLTLDLANMYSNVVKNSTARGHMQIACVH